MAVPCVQNTFKHGKTLGLVHDFSFLSTTGRYRSTSWVLLMLAWGIGARAQTTMSPVTSPSMCPESPLAFRADIRPLDVWEEAWEAQWPHASDAMQAWRHHNFDQLQGVWRHMSPLLPELKAEATNRGLAESAAFLVLWSQLPDPTKAASLSVQAHSTWNWPDPRLSAAEAMTEAFQQSGSSMPLSDWTAAVRTGLRLMENFEMPPVHVVAPGETVYSIARLHDVPPSCLGDKNGVWDNLQPGTPLLIPNLSPPR